MSANELLSAKEVAARWHVSRRLVLDLAQRGHLAHVRLTGKAIRFKLADIEAYEQAGYHPAPARPLRLRRQVS